MLIKISDDFCSVLTLPLPRSLDEKQKEQNNKKATKNNNNNEFAKGNECSWSAFLILIKWFLFSLFSSPKWKRKRTILHESEIWTWINAMIEASSKWSIESCKFFLAVYYSHHHVQLLYCTDQFKCVIQSKTFDIRKMVIKRKKNVVVFSLHFRFSHTISVYFCSLSLFYSLLFWVHEIVQLEMEKKFFCAKMSIRRPPNE